MVKNLDDWFTVELSYNSNALEGNTLTKRETALVIEQGITIGGKSLREHLEVINYWHALDYVKELARKNRNSLKLLDILQIHQIVLKGIDDQSAGRLRTVQVFICGSDVIQPHPLKVPDLMEDFIDWLHSATDHPVLIAAQAHFRLVAIHPFVDGNGRTARLLMTLLLMQSGYAPIVVEVAERLSYVESIHKGESTGDLTDFICLMLVAEIKSLDRYLTAVGIV